MSSFDRKLSALMRDYGYELRGKYLYSIGIRGFSSDSLVHGGCNSHFAAAESLIPIIHLDEYFERFQRICQPR